MKVRQFDRQEKKVDFYACTIFHPPYNFAHLINLSVPVVVVVPLSNNSSSPNHPSRL
jgi:hypothetical protein